MTDDELRTFVRKIVREEVRKALDEELRMLRIQAGITPRYLPPRMETKELPAWARQEGGTAH